MVKLQAEKKAANLLNLDQWWVGRNLASVGSLPMPQFCSFVKETKIVFFPYKRSLSGH